MMNNTVILEQTIENNNFIKFILKLLINSHLLFQVHRMFRVQLNHQPHQHHQQ